MLIGKVLNASEFLVCLYRKISFRKLGSFTVKVFRVKHIYKEINKGDKTNGNFILCYLSFLFFSTIFGLKSLSSETFLYSHIITGTP